MAKDSFLSTFSPKHVFLCINIFFALTEKCDSQFSPICGHTGYDLGNLTARIWQFDVIDTDNTCLQHPNTTGDSCRFYLAFCRDLKKLMFFACDDASVCQQNTKDKSQVFNVGGYEQNPFKEDAKYNPNGFIVDYPHGGTYELPNGTSCTLSVRLSFTCSKTAYWDLPSDSSARGTVPGPIPVLFNNDSCKYEILVNYAGACYYVAPLPVAGLSAGSILVIIFFATLSAYCLFGTSIKCVQGSRGKAAVPNVSFWSELPVYISDGFIFVFQGFKYKKKTYDDI